MRDISFTPNAFEQYNQWAILDKKLFLRLERLIKESAKTPFEGTGKPEPLKNELKGYWSRRITDEHRLVYRVNDEIIKIVQCKYHY
jgi:toxin YoeB